MTLLFEDLEKKWMKNQKFVKELERQRPQYELVRALIKARVAAELSQAQLAKRMGTTQSAIARIESGTHSTSIKSLQKYAHATNQIISIEIHP